LEMLVTTQVGKNPGLLTLLLETAQGAFEGFSILHPDTGQVLPPSLPLKNVMRLDGHPGLRCVGCRVGAKCPFAVYCPPHDTSTYKPECFKAAIPDIPQTLTLALAPCRPPQSREAHGGRLRPQPALGQTTRGDPPPQQPRLFLRRKTTRR